MCEIVLTKKEMDDIIDWACFFIENRPQRDFTDRMDELIKRIERIAHPELTHLK